MLAFIHSFNALMKKTSSGTLILCLLMLFSFSSSSYAAAGNKKTIKVCNGGNLKTLERKLTRYRKIMTKYSQKYDVSEALIKAVITAESCFNERALSPKGAQGLMQLMPGTARRFGISNSYDPDANIRGGTRYLKYLLNYYDEYMIDAIAAYNAGEGAVDKYKGVPPYNETIQYVAKVDSLYKLYTQGVKVSSVFAEGKVRYSVFKPQPMPQSKFSPYIGRKRNISRGNCANRTGTRLRKSTYLQRGKGVWQRVYTAKKGDTLMRVMQKTGVHKNKIKQMNHLQSRSRLNAGQRLLLWECRK